MQIFLDPSWLITFTNSLCVKKTDSYPIHSITQFDQSHQCWSEKCVLKKTNKNCTFVNYVLLGLHGHVESVCTCFGHLVFKHQIGFVQSVWTGY